MYHTREASDHKVTHTSLNVGGLLSASAREDVTQPEAAHVAEGSDPGRFSISSRFSSESAPRPFHHGVRGRGGNWE